MSGWKVNIGGQEYPARDREMILEWFRANRITPTSMIFDPIRDSWVTLDDFAKDAASTIVLTTTNTIEGHRITHYLGLQTGESATTAFNLNALKALGEARLEAEDLLRRRAVLHGGNAVLSVKVDYFQFTELVLCVSMVGTVVRIEPSAG